MKKWLAMLLAAAMCLTLLAGCGSSSGSSDSEGTSEAAEESDSAYIEGNGKLVIGYTDYAPMNYYDSETGELVGFDTDFAKAVCEKLGLEAEFVEINWDAKETELSSKTIDCIWNGFSINDERKQNMGVTDPYLSNTQVIICKKDREKEIMSKMDGYSFTAEAGSTGEARIQGTDAEDGSSEVHAADYFAKCEYFPSDSMAKAIQEVEAGTADFAVVNKDCAYGMIGPDTDYSDLVINEDNNFGNEYFGIAFRKGSDMVEKVNDIIDELYADGTIAKIAADYADSGVDAMLLEQE